MEDITKLSNTIAKQLKHLRKIKNITQEKLINDIGEENISLRSYKTYEKGGTNIPTLDKLVLLCEYFGCSLDYLVFGVNVTKDNSFTLKDNLIRLSRLIHSLMLQPVQETNPDSPYYGKYFFVSYDNNTDVFVSKFEEKVKELNDEFEYNGKNSFISLKTYDEIIGKTENLSEDLSPTYKRFSSLLIESGIDPEEYKKQHFERINRRRAASKLKNS